MGDCSWSCISICLLLLIGLRKAAAGSIEAFLAARPCDSGYNIRLVSKLSLPENIRTEPAEILLQALSPACTNAAQLAKNIITLDQEQEAPTKLEKQALEIALRARMHLPLAASTVEQIAEEAEGGALLPESEPVLGEQSYAALIQRTGQFWRNFPLNALYQRELSEIALNPEELNAAQFKDVEILYRFIHQARLLNDGTAIKTVMDKIWAKESLRSKLPLYVILDVSATVNEATWRTHLLLQNVRIHVLIPELMGETDKPYLSSEICEAILSTETEQNLHYCAALVKYKKSQLESVAPLLLTKNPEQELIFRSAERDFVDFLRQLSDLELEADTTLESTIVEFVKSLEPSLDWAIPLTQRADLMRAHFGDQLITNLLAATPHLRVGLGPFEDSLLVAYARATFDRLPQGGDDVEKRLVKLRELSFFNVTEVTVGTNNMRIIRFDSLLRGQRLLIERLMQRLLDVVRSSPEADHTERGRLGQANLVPGKITSFTLELGGIGLQWQWLLEMVRNPNTGPDERLLALANLVTGPYKIRGDTNNLLQLDWLLGDYKNGFILSETVADSASFLKIFRDCLRDPFWRQVILLALVDRISKDVLSFDPPHYILEGEEPFGGWSQAALEVLDLRNKPATEENQEKLQSLIGQYSENYAPSFEPDNCPRGLARINQSIKRTPSNSIQEPIFEGLKSIWPLGTGYLTTVEPDVFLEILGLLEKYRRGLGITNLVMQAVSGTILASDPQDTQWKVIWSTAFRRATDTRHLDLLLKTVPLVYCNTLHNHQQASLGWVRLALTVNTHRESLEVRRTMAKDLGEFLSEHSVQGEPMHGLAFMLLDSFDAMRDYKTLLGKLYRRYGPILSNRKLDTVDDSSSLKERRYRLLRDLLIERLYSLDARKGEHADVTAALEGLGRYMFERALKDKRTLSEASRISLSTELLAADAGAAEPHHWLAFFGDIIDGGALMTRVDEASLLSTVFQKLKQANWSTLFGQGVFLPARMEAYFWKIRRVRQFSEGSAVDLKNFIEARLEANKNQPLKRTIVEGPPENAQIQGEVEGTAEVGTLEKQQKSGYIDSEGKAQTLEGASPDVIEDIILYRILDFITDSSKTELAGNLYGATRSLSTRHGLHKTEDPLASLIELVEIPPSHAANPTPSLANPTTVASALFSMAFESDQPLNPTSNLLVEALKAPVLSTEDSFKKAFEKFVLETIIPLPNTMTHTAFINRYRTLGPEAALNVMSAQLKTHSYAFSEVLRRVIGARKFDLFHSLIMDTPPPPLEVSMGPEKGEEPRNERGMSPLEALLQSLDLVMTREEDAKKLIERGRQSVQIILTPPPLQTIEACNCLTFEKLLREEPNPKVHTPTCINHLSHEQKLKLLSRPRIFTSVLSRVDPNLLPSLPKRMLTAMSPEQLTNNFSQSPELCDHLKDDAILRPLWARGLLNQLSPGCLKASGTNWFHVFIHIPAAYDSHHQSYAQAAELAAILGPENFEGINAELYLLADIPHIFYQNLGKEVSSPEKHPCTAVSDDLGYFFWKYTTRKCLLAPRPSGKTLLASARASQIAYVEPDTLLSLSPEELLQFDPKGLPALESGLRALFLKRLKDTDDFNRVQEYEAAASRYRWLKEEFDQIYHGAL